jgi:glycosyltransferase involved in cell wall biosynthesis
MNQHETSDPGAGSYLRRFLARYPWVHQTLRFVRQRITRALRGLLSILTAWITVVQFVWLRRFGRRRIPTTAPVQERPLIVMLVRSNLPVDPRVEREARTLVSHGYRVKVICPQWWPVTPAPDWGRDITFKILPAYLGDTGFLSYLFVRKMRRAALAEPAWVYHAHDLDTALPALLAAARRRVLCVCDFHEWYSENVTYDYTHGVYRPHGQLKRYVFRRLESLALCTASRVITVCDSIGAELDRIYGSDRKVAVIRNIPFITPSEMEAPASNLRARLRISPHQRVVLYQGGVGPSRNLEPVIRAMAHVPRGALVIRGPSVEAFSAGYLKLAADVGAGGRVFCLPAVPSARVVAEARAADIGLWTLLANVGLNFKYALPNKVFEYLAAGLPLLVADCPEVRRLVEQYGVGRCFDPDDPASIAAAINRFVQDDSFLRACRSNIAGALEDLCADREWDKLARLYRDLQEGEEVGDMSRAA